MIKRSAKLSAAIVLIVSGLILLPLPIPLGLLSLLIGFSLLVSAVPAVRFWVIALRRRYRQTSARLNQLSHKMPGFLRDLIVDTDPENHTTKIK